MLKNNKVKNLKNMVSSLDINKLYKLQEYVSVSSEFFKEFDSYIYEWENSFYSDRDYCFTKKCIDLYDSMKNKLNIDEKSISYEKEKI